MGASYRKITVVAACGLGLFAAQPALADGDSWLGKISSITSSLIPDINLAAYLDGKPAVDDQAVAERSDFERSLVGGAPQLGFRYRVVDSEVDSLGSSAGVYLLSLDSGVQSKVNGLGRAAAAESRLPTYGLDLGYSFSSRWSFGMRGHFLDIETTELDSSQSAYSAGFEYAAGNEMSVGFGYEQFELQGDPQFQAQPGYVAYRYSGPRVYTMLRF